MKKIYYLLLTLAITSFAFGQDMVITGAFDGPLAGGTPKLIEVYVINDITDLSTYGFGSATNGGGTDGQELPFVGSATAGDFIYITDGGNGGEANLMTYFGIEPDYVSSAAAINGDDALELFSGGVVIDTFGDINADGTGTPWDYLDGWAYRTSSTGPDGATFTIANWTFSGINANDSCGSNSTCASEFPIGSFTNEAVSVCTASEGFETFPLVDWTLYSSNTSNGVTQSTSWANSGLNSLRFASYSSASTYDQYAVTPQLVTTSGDQTISFYYKSSSSSGTERFKVGTSSTGDDFANDFTWSDEIVSSTTAAQYSSDLPVGTKYVAIHYYSNYQYYMYVDDFCMPELYVPDCLSPTDLAVSDITPTTASVTWIANNGEMAWEYQYVESGATPAETGTATSDNPLALTALTSNTSYDVYVRANCDTDGMSDWSMVSFTTPCEVYSIPYFEGFEAGYTHASTVGGCLSQESISGMGTWLANNTLTSYNRAPRTGDWNAYVGYGNEDWLFISVDLTADMSYTASVHARQDGSTASNSDITISYGASASAAAMTNTIVPATGIVNGDYQLISGAFTPTTSGTHVIGIKGYMNFSPYYISLDDISIDLSPDCLMPTNLAVSDITTTTASVSWTANNGETDWEYQYVESGATPAETGTATSDNPLALTALTSNTSYDVYVRANCDTDGMSDWSMVSFTTPCEAYSIPYFEGFESGYTHASSVGGCLSQESITGTGTWAANNTLTSYNRAPRTGDWNAYVGYGNEDWLFISVDLTADTSYTASVYARQDGSTASNSNITISYGASASAAAMTNTIVPATGIVNGDYQLISGAFTPTTSGTHVIGIKGYMNFSPYYISLDDISIDLSPDCLMPTNLAVSDITTTTASVSWTANNGETDWEYQYVESGATPAETGTATSDNPLALTALTSNTSYDVYVRANCGDGSFSAWIQSTFTTLPGCGDTVTDSGGSTGNYAANELTTVTVYPDNAGDLVTFTFLSFNTESCCDDLTVYDGPDTSSTVFGTYAGSTIPDPITSSHSTGALTFVFDSDSSLQYGGYEIAISCSPPPFTPPTWVGDWLLDPVAGALAVGPNAGSVGLWYASSAADVDTRACLFDDIHRFNVDGTYEQIMQDQTWLEAWQGVGVTDGCGTPIAPHDGSNAATYTYTGETVTVIGDGAFMGLAKVHSTGQDGVSGGSITYNIVSVDENYLVVNIQYAPGADDTWQFRFRNANYTPPTTDVTFTVNTESIEEVGPNGMYLGGGILGGAQAYAMTDADADGTWEVTLTLNEGTTGNYIFLNSPSNDSDWGTKEVLTGQECADGEFDDRLLAPVGADDYTLQHCFGSCDTDGTCSSLGIDDAELSQFTYFPNPVNNVLSIKAQASIDSITVYNMLGQTVVKSTPNTTTTAVDMSGLQTGAYFVQVAINNSIETVRVIKN